MNLRMHVVSAKLKKASCEKNDRKVLSKLFVKMFLISWTCFSVTSLVGMMALFLSLVNMTKWMLIESQSNKRAWYLRVNSTLAANPTNLVASILFG